jgi:hypothetical protein
MPEIAQASDFFVSKGKPAATDVTAPIQTRGAILRFPGGPNTLIEKLA